MQSFLKNSLLSQANGSSVVCRGPLLMDGATSDASVIVISLGGPAVAEPDLPTRTNVSPDITAYEQTH
jgi:hypothetical protein